MKRAYSGCLLLIFLVIGGCSVPYILHNRALSRLRVSYPRVTHPPSNSVLASFSDVGLLGGANGNHCDYLVGEIRESDESPDQIRQHYSGLSLPMIDPAMSDWGPGPDVPVTVEFPDTDSNSGILKYDIPDAVREARAKQRKKTLYAVFVLDGGYQPNGDWRCH